MRYKYHGEVDAAVRLLSATQVRKEGRKEVDKLLLIGCYTWAPRPPNQPPADQLPHRRHAAS